MAYTPPYYNIVNFDLDDGDGYTAPLYGAVNFDMSGESASGQSEFFTASAGAIAAGIATVTSQQIQSESFTASGGGITAGIAVTSGIHKVSFVASSGGIAAGTATVSVFQGISESYTAVGGGISAGIAAISTLLIQDESFVASSGGIAAGSATLSTYQLQDESYVASAGAIAGGSADVTLPVVLWGPEYTDPAVWLDASDSDTISLGDLNWVQTWQDKSGGLEHAVQDTQGARPEVVSGDLNSLDVIKFAGFNEFMISPVQADGWGGMTIFHVVARSTGSSYAAMNVGYSNSNGILMYNGYNGTDVASRAGATTSIAAASSGTAENVEDWQISGGTHDLSNVTAYHNGVAGTAVAQSTTSINAENDAGIGCMFASGASIYDQKTAEILIFDYALDSDERETVEGYLAHKWGLESLLAAGHTYKSDPPYYTAPTTANHVATGGGVASGTGKPPIVHVATAGAVVSGIANYSAGRISTGGGISAGVADFAYIGIIKAVHSASGGAIIGGLANLAALYPVVGGAVAGGSLSYGFNHIPEGGSVAGGNVTPRQGFYATGGAVASGQTIRIQSLSYTSIGGAVVAGSVLPGILNFGALIVEFTNDSMEISI